MRIWSLHPSHLDAKGLVALWRESLLAKHVLEGKTRGYKNHLQLTRFKNCPNPADAINYYLSFIYLEAKDRNYRFDDSKINPDFKKIELTVTKGQLDFEIAHLLKKLSHRDPAKLKELKLLKTYSVHPIFKLLDGDIEIWEIL